MSNFARHSGAIMHPHSCIFCGSGPVVEQFIYGTDFRRFAGPNTYFFTDYTTNERTELPPGESALSQTVQVACSECIDGWLGELDERVQPAVVALIEGRPHQFSLDTVNDFVLWAALISIKRAFLGPDRGVTDDDIKYVYEHREPCPGWLVFLGHSSTIGLNGECRYRFIDAYDPDPGAFTELKTGLLVPTVHRFTFQEHAFALNDLVLICFSLAGVPSLIAAATAHIEQVREAMLADLLKLWPAPSAFSWPVRPPAHPLTQFLPMFTVWQDDVGQ